MSVATPCRRPGAQELDLRDGLTMSSDQSWPNLLSLIGPEVRGIALISLLIEAAAIAAIPLLPSEQRIYAFVVLACVLIATLVGTVYVAARSRSQDHDQPHFQAKVMRLRDRLVADRFLPELIIAIPRGGLSVAGVLARQLGDNPIVPVITLTRMGQPNFDDNAFNRIQFTRSDFQQDGNHPVNVLIVDDICRSGRTLAEAKDYVTRSVDRDGFLIKTAAISFYRTHDRAIAPSFYVERPEGTVRDASGEIEPMSD
jgi:hypoxanthine phosphoribosyltransferase